METAESIYDYIDTESYPESAYGEARGKWRPAPRPSGGKLTGPAPQQGYVSRNEFNAAMEKVRSELSATSAGLKTLDGRVNTVTATQERIGKELVVRKKEAEDLRRDLRQTRELTALLPLIASNSTTFTVPSGAGIPPALVGQKLLAPSTNNLAMMAPLLLLGMGDSSSGGSGGTFGSDSTMMMLLLVMAMQK